MDTRIYCITHKKFEKPEDDMYRPLHVGRAISDDLGYQGDDKGDNISEKNKSYCELTGIYWLWKNVKCDIIGICHYRRYFVRDEGFITKEYIEDILNNQKYDVIVPTSGETSGKTIKEQYAEHHYIKDFEKCEEVLKRMYPQYSDAFDLTASCGLFTLGNMIITHKSTFDKYCEWLFPLLYEIEEETDISSYDEFQKRLYGYLAERLFRVWLMGNALKVREEKVRMIDVSKMESAQKVVDLQKQCLELVLKQYLMLCKEAFHENMWSDICDINDAALGKTPVDFHGKIPVFACWWQGFDEAPDMIKRCLDSVDRNLDESLTEFHLITLENVGNYVSFPDWIVEKFNDGTISYTHLSDILRMALLNKYGGIWIDATYYMTQKFDERILKCDKSLVGKSGDDYLWTIKHEKSKWKVDVVGGRWSGNFLYVNKKNPLARFAINAFYEYWRTQKEMIDYFMIDDIINIGYEQIPAIKELIDSVGYSNPRALDLGDILDNRFDEKQWEELTRDTSIFKLQRRVEHSLVNIVGKKTFYGHLMTYNIT